MARYAVIVRSLETGRLHVLDAWPEGARSIEVEEIQVRGGRLDELLAVTRAEFEAAVALLETGPLADETGWARIEDTANRYHEVQKAERTGAPLRIASDRLIPERAARRPLRPVLALPPAERRAELAHTDRALAELHAELDAQSAYNLVTRNCVSEVFRAINEVLDANPSVSGMRGVTARLGGHIAGNEGLGFVPFVSADRVADRYRVIETMEWPSHRRRMLQRVYEAEGDGFGIYFREANTLTSTLYRHNADDSIFLFFTDDVVALRPVYGVLNLVAGIGATVVGIPFALFDGGRLLSAGARGAFWSMPELGFLSVRKGSFFFVSDTDRVGSRGKAE
jgi:hypothetical protein